MTFTTLTFLLFVPLVFSVYWLIPSRWARNCVLIIASYSFYSWWDVRFSVLMLISSLIDFGAGRLLQICEKPTARRAILIASCGAGLGLLGFFKYCNFFIENLQRVITLVGMKFSLQTLQIVLPVGISFYTFQTMSYVIDVYRRRIAPTGSLIDYLAYVSFFPQLVAGPIERAANLLPQFEKMQVFDPSGARDGLRLILWGFFKKLALADNLGVVVDAAYRNPEAANGPTLLVATLCFAFQIYCDFSAYSDIATGCARLFGIRLMRNFAYPYFSRSVSEFWRRWHISLSTWFADYVYVPLGGNRTSRLRHAANVMMTFLLSGLWHGPSWNFLIWGGLHGLAVLPSSLHQGPKIRSENMPGGEGILPSFRALTSMFITFAFVCITWVFFRAHSLPVAVIVLKKIGSGPWSAASIGSALGASSFALSLTSIFVIAEWLTRGLLHPLQMSGWPRPIRWAVYTALLWITLGLSPGVTGPFIYFQF